jgi:uncharacterized protein (DUF4213/DUF364 family)
MRDSNQVYKRMRKAFTEMAKEVGLETEVEVFAGPLKIQDALGDPEEKDYPLQKGKEKLMEATVLNSRGQAYTDMYGNYQGTLSEVIALELKDNFQRAVFVSTLNALLRHLKKVEKTSHCKNEGMGQCGKEIVDYVKERYGSPKIWLVGMQPRLLENLSRQFQLRITDLDPDNIGSEKSGAVIESPSAADEDDISTWCDLIVATGTIFVNNTFDAILSCGKPVVLYGVTAAGPAHVLGIQRYCPYGR